jgi:hypothetical protein
MAVDNPFPYSQFEKPDGTILMQEITSYIMKDNKIVKVTVTRKFTEDDYDDSMVTEVLHSW